MTVDQFFDHFAPFVADLRDRWADESEYEDFAEYKAVIRARAADVGARVTDVTPSPFRVYFQLAGQRCVMHATARKVTLRIIGAALIVSTPLSTPEVTR